MSEIIAIWGMLSDWQQVLVVVLAFLAFLMVRYALQAGNATHGYRNGR